MEFPTDATASQGAGQPPAKAAAPAETGQPPASDAAQPQFVTLEQVQQMLEENFRRAQSLYSKGQAGFEKKIQADLKNLEKALDLQKKAGFTISPEQEAQMKQQVINQAFTEAEQPTPAELPAQQPAQAEGVEEPPDPITAEAWAMMEEAGVDINEDDPEYKLVDNNTQSVRKFLGSIQAAIEAKKLRLAAQPEQTAPARMPTNQGGAGSGQSNLITGPIKLDELWERVQRSGKF